MIDLTKLPEESHFSIDPQKISVRNPFCKLAPELEWGLLFQMEKLTNLF